MPSPVIRFRIDFSDHAYLGPGKIALLEAVRDSGSLSQAARKLRMSYRRAWLLLASVNASFTEPVTVAKTGGKGGGGVAITDFGNVLIGDYRALEADITRIAAKQMRTIAIAVRPRAPGAKAARRSIARKPERRDV
jgi:molybdate transport system regulatory protein